MLEGQSIWGRPRGLFDHLSIVPMYVGCSASDLEEHEMNTWALSCTCDWPKSTAFTNSKVYRATAAQKTLIKEVTSRYTCDVCMWRKVGTSGMERMEPLFLARNSDTYNISPNICEQKTHSLLAEYIVTTLTCTNFHRWCTLQETDHECHVPGQQTPLKLDFQIQPH